MAKKFPLHPAHPERTCWGCDLYCAADAMRCGNGSERTQHPVELFGDDWMSFGLDAERASAAPSDGTAAATAPAAPIRVERQAPSRAAGVPGAPADLAS